MRLVRWATAAAAAAAVVVAAAGCHDRFDPPAGSDVEAGATLRANISIGDLAAMYRGTTVAITDTLVIAGRVTSSDRAGNFRYSFMVEQDGAAVEVLARQTDLHNIYPTGCSLCIRLRGLVLGERTGVKCIGEPAAAYEYYPAGYILSREELDSRIAITRAPEPFGIPSVSLQMLDRRMCGCLVRVASLRRVADNDGDDDSNSDVNVAGPATWRGYNIFEDADGQGRIAVWVSDYANFAGHAAPDSAAAIAGILQYGRPDGADEDMFILKPRDENDIIPY